MQTAIIYGAWLGNDRGLVLAVDPAMWVGQFIQERFSPNRCVTLNPWFVVDNMLRDPNAVNRWTIRNLGLFQDGPVPTTVLLLTESAVQYGAHENLEHLGYFLLSEICNEFSEQFPKDVLAHLKRIDTKSVMERSA